MKFIKFGLLCCVSYAAMTAHAHAELISLTATLIHGFLLTSTSIAAAATGAIATGLAYATVIGGAIGLSLLTRPRTSSAAPQDVKSTFEASEAPELEGCGRVRVGGLQAFGNSNGYERYRLICRLKGPIDAVEEYYVGGREVTVDSDGYVSTPPWPVAGGGSYLKWQDKRGDGTETSWPELVAEFPTLWTADHRVRGIAQALITFGSPGLTSEKFTSLYQNGVPATEEVVRASPVYDPRDATQIVDNPSTWRWSENGILCVVHILRRDPAFTSSRFDWPSIIDAANSADASVSTKTGTERRSRFGGVWSAEGQRADVLSNALDSVGAEMRMTADGKITFLLEEDVPGAEIGFSPSDCYEVQFSSGPEAVERPNICRLKYYSPERNYELTEIDLSMAGWSRIDAEVVAYGPKYLDIDLPFCPSASQAQRIARRKFLQARADSGSLVTNMVGLAAWGKLYASLEWPDIGLTETIKIGAPRSNDAEGSVSIPFIVYPTLAPWNTTTDEAPAPEPIPDIEFDSDVPTPSAPSEVLQITYPDTTSEVRFSYAPAPGFDSLEATLRTYTDGLPNPWQATSEKDAYSYLGINAGGGYVNARVRAIIDDDVGYFSPQFAGYVTTNNTACAAPTHQSGGAVAATGTVTLNAVVRVAEMRCAGVRVDRKVGAGAFTTIATINARPEEDVVVSGVGAGATGTAVYFNLYAITSNGTLSPSMGYSGVTL